MLKADWEKADELETLTDAAIRAMAAAAAGRQLQSYAVIQGGCANLNVKLSFEAGRPPLILRVYLRDPEAAAREQKLSELLAGAVPVPRVLERGVFEGRSFALVEYAQGITLRDLLLRQKQADIAPVMREAGGMLAAIGRFTFKNQGGEIRAGTFDENLQVKPGEPPDFVEFAAGCLAQDNVVSALTAPVAEKLGRLIAENRAHLPVAKAPRLVHGDFDPANLLVNDASGTWKISAVLDWEFAFSGSFQWDVSNMLRDAHRLPPVYGASFLEGLETGGVRLPVNWRRTLSLTNLLSLLYMLRQADPAAKPRARRDMAELILHFTTGLERPA